MEPNYPAMDPNVMHPSQSTISAAVIEPLRRTKGWARFLSVLGYIGSGLMIIIGLLMIIGAAAGGMASGSSRSAIAAGVPFGVMGAVYVVMALFYLVPAFWLGRYASRIGNLIQTQTEMDLVAALDAQRSFWKFIGVLTLVMICIYLGGIVIMVIVGVAGFANM